MLGLAREATGPDPAGHVGLHRQRQALRATTPRRPRRSSPRRAGRIATATGIVEDKDGKPFTFTIRTNQGNDERKKVAEIIQQRSRSIGVHVEIQHHRVGRASSRSSSRSGDSRRSSWAGAPAPTPTSTWSGTPRRRGPDELNHIAYANPEVDHLLEAGRASCHAGRAACKYYHRLQEMLAEDLPMVFLYFRDALPVVAARVQGVEPGARRHPATTSPSGSCPKHARYTAVTSG